MLLFELFHATSSLILSPLQLPTVIRTPHISPMSSVCKATSLHPLSNTYPSLGLKHKPLCKAEQHPEKGKVLCYGTLSLLFLHFMLIKNITKWLVAFKRKKLCFMREGPSPPYSLLCPQESPDDNSRHHSNVCQVQSWALEVSDWFKYLSIYDPVTKMILLAEESSIGILL